MELMKNIMKERKSVEEQSQILKCVCSLPTVSSKDITLWLTLTLQHDRECVCVLIGPYSTLMGGVLACEVVRCEAPAELCSAGIFTTTMSWRPALMAIGSLAATVTSRHISLWIRTTQNLHLLHINPYPALIFQYNSDSMLGFWSALHIACSNRTGDLGDCRPQ